jgi:hypothetical protein
MARFVTEVAPQQVVSTIMRRRRKQVLRRLDPIAEDDEREHQLAYGTDHHLQTAAAGMKRPPQERERAGGRVDEGGARQELRLRSPQRPGRELGA